MKAKNKGYTLIELLLAMAIMGIVMAQIGSIIYSTTNLYRRGTGEVTLQSDAQQVIKLFEELAVDCNGSVTAGPNFVKIENKAVNYGGSAPVDAVTYVFTLDPMTKKLTLTVSSPAGSVTPVPQLVAENVKTFSLTTDSTFSYSSKALLTVEMEKDIDNHGTVYEYTATKDIYFRNHLGADDKGDGGDFIDPALASAPDPSGGGVAVGGSGGGGGVPEGAGEPAISSDSKVLQQEILRYKEYSIADIVPADWATYGLNTYEFQLCDSMGNFITCSSISGEYSGYPFASQDRNGHLDYSKIMWRDPTDPHGTDEAPYYFKSRENGNLFIKVYANDLTLGMVVNGDSTGTLHLDQYQLDNVSFYSGTIPFETCVNARTPSYICASGISLADCREVTVTPYLKFSADKIDDVIDSKLKYYKIKTADGTIYPYTIDIAEKWPGETDYYFCDQEVVVPIGETKQMCGKNFDGSGTYTMTHISSGQLSSGEVRVYMGEGYDESSLTAGKEVKDVLEKGKFDKDNPYFQFQYTFSSHGTGSVNYDGIFIDEDRNGVAFMTGQMDFSQTNASKVHSNNSKVDKAAKFYECGGEIFFDVRVIYGTAGVDEKVYDIKVVPDCKCSETGHNSSCTVANPSQYVTDFKNALSSSMSTPNAYELKIVNGKKAYVFKDGSSSSGSGGSGSMSGGSGGTEIEVPVVDPENPENPENPDDDDDDDDDVDKPEDEGRHEGPVQDWVKPKEEKDDDDGDSSGDSAPIGGATTE